MLLWHRAADRIFRPLAIALALLGAGMIVGAIVIVAIGANPIVAYSALFSSAFGSASGISNVLTRCAPLIMTALALGVSFRAGIFNLGGEGQLYLGAFAGAAVGYLVPVPIPPVVHITLALAASGLAGALGALIPGWLKVRLAVDEIITTIMLNFVFLFLTGQLAMQSPFNDPTRWSGQTFAVRESARLPVLVPGLDVNAGILIAAVIALAMYWILSRTDVGYRWKVVGLNEEFARYVGIDVARERLTAMVLSGALAGLGGGLLILGSQYRFVEGTGYEVAWDGVILSLLAGHNPVVILVAGVIFAGLKTGSLGMEQASGVVSELTDVLLSLMILVVTGRDFLSAIWTRIFLRPLAAVGHAHGSNP